MLLAVSTFWSTFSMRYRIKVIGRHFVCIVKESVVVDCRFLNYLIIMEVDQAQDGSNNAEYLDTKDYLGQLQAEKELLDPSYLVATKLLSEGLLIY